MSRNDYVLPKDLEDTSLFKALKIPECLHELMQFAGIKFTPKGGAGILSVSLWKPEKIADPQSWILTMPTSIEGKRVEIPINDPIDEKDPEGHWRVYMAAAADFQYLVNSGQYKPA